MLIELSELYLLTTTTNDTFEHHYERFSTTLIMVIL